MPPDDKAADGDIALKGGPKHGSSADETGGAGDKAGGGEGAGKAASDAGKGQLVTVNYGGKTFKVTSDVAETLKAQADELEKARKSRWTPPTDDAPAPKKKAAPADEGDDDSDLMFTDPKAWKAKLRAEVKSEVMNEVRTAYTAEQSQKAFWDTFSKVNSDLEDARDLAEPILKKHYAEWVKEGLTVEQTIARLADKTRDRIDRLTSTRGDPNSRKGKKQSEGASSGGDGKGKQKAAADDDDGEADESNATPRTTAQILKARKEARRQLGNQTQH